VVEKKRTGEKEERNGMEHGSAGLAAGRQRLGIGEVKQARRATARALVGLDVMEGKEEMTAGVSPLWMVPSKVGLPTRLLLPAFEFLSSPLCAHVTRHARAVQVELSCRRLLSAAVTPPAHAHTSPAMYPAP
jgi:hypothetical protein